MGEIKWKEQFLEKARKEVMTMRIDSIQRLRGLYQVCMKGVVDDGEVALYATQQYDTDTGKIVVEYTQYGANYTNKEMPQDWKDNLTEVLEFITRRF